MQDKSLVSKANEVEILFNTMNENESEGLSEIFNQSKISVSGLVKF